jgi:hypothetical protein
MLAVMATSKAVGKFLAVRVAQSPETRLAKFQIKSTEKEVKSCRDEALEEIDEYAEMLKQTVRTCAPRFFVPHAMFASQDVPFPAYLQAAIDARVHVPWSACKIHMHHRASGGGVPGAAWTHREADRRIARAAEAS